MSVKKAVCICAAEREVIGQGYHYDNNHNQYIKRLYVHRERIPAPFFLKKKLIGVLVSLIHVLFTCFFGHGSDYRDTAERFLPSVPGSD